MHVHPLTLYLPSRTKLQCTLQLKEHADTLPVFPLYPIYTLCLKSMAIEVVVKVAETAERAEAAAGIKMDER
jgi:hypothetical protein